MSENIEATPKGSPSATPNENTVDAPDNSQPENQEAVAPKVKRNLTGAEAAALVKEAEEKGQKLTDLLGKKKPSRFTSNNQPLKETTEEPSNQNESKTPPEPKQETVRKFKVKVDGQEQEVDEATLIKNFVHSTAAQKRMQEAMDVRKQNLEFLQLAKDPQQFLKLASRFGHDPLKLAESIVVNQINDELLDPKDKELRDLRAKFEAQEKREQAALKARQDAEIEQKRQQLIQEFNTSFKKALETVKIPRTEDSIQRMAIHMRNYAAKGIEITAEDAARLVKEDLKNSDISLFKGATAEELYELLGDERVAQLLQHRGKKVAKPLDYSNSTLERGSTSHLKKDANTYHSNVRWRRNTK